MKKNLHFLPFQTLLIGAVLLSSAAVAQQKKPDTLRNNTLEEVVVTTLRKEVKRKHVPQNVTVITKADIALTSSQEFTDLLKKNASVNIVQYPGLLAGVGIRGFRPQTSGLNQRSLLLVDGRPAGTANIATINPSDIERIEVLKGPGSAMYGSSAMGGVVNIITKKSAGVVHGDVFAEYGSYETSKLGASAGGNITQRLDFDLSFLNFDRSKDMKLGKGNFFRDLLNGDKAVKNYDLDYDGKTDTSTTVDDKRSDGLRRTFSKLNYNTGSMRLGYQLNDKWRLDVRAERFIANDVEAPSDIFTGNGDPSTKDIERYNEEATVSGSFLNHVLSVKAYTAKESNLNYTFSMNGAALTSYASYKSAATWKGIQAKDVYTIGRHSLVFGLDYSDAATRAHSFDASGAETVPYSPNYNLSSAAGYVQGQFNFLDDQLIINPGVRMDFITYNVKQTPLLSTYAGGKETNPFVSPSLAAQYTVARLFTLHASAGRAFITPDAYNVAGFSEKILSDGKVNVIRGNAALKNENSISFDAGLRFAKSELGLTADVTYFNTHVKDRISQRSTSPVNETTESGHVINTVIDYVNANTADINGFEAELAWDFGTFAAKDYSLRLFANGTRTVKAEEMTIAEDGKRSYKDVYNVADFTASYGVEFNNLKGLDIRLNGRYVGNRKDTDFNDDLYPEIVYPEFMVLDFGAGYTFEKKHTVTFLMNNVTDENYYEKRGFNLAGRNFSLRYSYKF